MAAAALRTRDELRGRRALVLGLARSGIALARMLSDAGARVTVYDRRPASELADALGALEGRPVELALAVPPEAAERLVADAELIFTSPSVSADFPTTDAWLRRALRSARADGVPVLSEVELFLRLTRARVMGVTGTKGKTTTTALLGEILAAGAVPHAVGGNIGRPLVEVAEELTEEHWAVLELSELQLPTISRGVDLAVYTNILADHLDRHGSVDAYRAVKARLAELAGPAARVVLNHDDPASRELADRLAARTPAEIHRYGHRRPALGGVEAWIAEGWIHVGEASEHADEARVMPIGDVPLPGAHMLSNALAAALAAHLVGVARPLIAEGIRRFRSLPHRLEIVATLHGVRYVNDSQATIPAAAEAALRAFQAPTVLIAGGRGKGLDYAALADAIAEHCRAVVLIGETASELQAAVGGRTRVERAASMQQAVATARRIAEPGDVVLLSPAAASFDMFADYAARGDAFRAAVASLDATGGPA